MADIKKNGKELDDSSLKDASGGKGRMRPRPAAAGCKKKRLD